jgi:hypothetical protein
MFVSCLVVLRRGRFFKCGKVDFGYFDEVVDCRAVFFDLFLAALDTNWDMGWSGGCVARRAIALRLVSFR